MKKQLGTKRGPKPMTKEEREARLIQRKAEARRKLEARRRAWFVLENKYNDDFKKVFIEEYEVLRKSHKANS
jgi:hypothetical protein